VLRAPLVCESKDGEGNEWGWESTGSWEGPEDLWLQLSRGLTPLAFYQGLTVHIHFWNVTV
jgi:hypothetical protein